MLQTSLFFHFRAKHSHLIYKQPSAGLEIKAKMGAHLSSTDLKTMTGQGEISSFSNVSFEHISGDFVKGQLKILKNFWLFVSQGFPAVLSFLFYRSP